MDGSTFSEITKKFQNLAEQGNIDKALNQLHHISSHINPQILHSTNIDIASFFTNIFQVVLPYSKDRNDKLKSRTIKFLNHWFNIIASFNTNQYFKIINNLQSLKLGQYMETAIEPFVEYFKYVKNKEEKTQILYNIVKELEFSVLEPLPEETWQIIKEYSTEQQVCDLISLYIDHEVNGKGVSILLQKNQHKFLELIFQSAHLQFIQDCLKNLPPKMEFDTVTISARLSDELFMEGGNASLAYSIIPLIIHSKNLDDVQTACFRPFWESAKNTLRKRNSTSCLYALHCGYQNKLISKDFLMPNLKLGDQIEPRYRLASFQIGIDFFDDPEFRPKMLDAITEISILRGNPIFCCLVDNLNFFYSKISEFNTELALLIVNNVMNPIPYDNIIPSYILRFLNSLDQINNPGFLFNLEEVVYKYMTVLNEELAQELKKLITKAGIVIDFKKIDWFDSSILLSLMVTEYVDPFMLNELLSFDYVHISLIPYAIDLITKSHESIFFNYAVGTLIKIIKQFGFSLNNELEKRHYRPIWLDTIWITESSISHSFHKMSVTLPKSNIGRVAISLANFIIALIYDVDPPKELRAAIAIMSKFLVNVNIEVSMNLLSCSGCENNEIINEVLTIFLSRIEFADPIQATKFLVKMKGEEKAIELSKETILKTVSIDYEVAKQFAPYLNQPIEKVATFSAFKGIEKHSKWVEECEKEIPKEQWILPQEEEPYIEEEIKEKKFEMKPIEIEKGIEGVWNGYKYDIINFFYFSEEKFPISLSIAEEFVMENSIDIRLVVGFFYYCNKNEYHTKQVEKWTKIIKFTDDERNLYAGSLFLLNLTNINFAKMPVYLSQFIHIGLRSIGYYLLSKKIIQKAYRKEAGMKWFFIRSIVNLDIDYFSDNPLISAEFAIERGKQTAIFQEFFQNMPVLQSIEPLLSTFISLTRVFFVPDKIVNLRNYPLAHVCLYNLKYLGSMPPTLRLEESFINSLLSALEKQPFFPVVFFMFFVHVHLNESQLKRVHDLLEPRTSSSGSYFMYLLPAAYFDRPGVKMIIDEKAAIYFSNRLPSFSRAFYRSLMMPFTPMFPQKLIVEIYDLLTPVFPPFSYNALNTWDQINNYDKILFQKYPKNALEKFKIVSRETVDIYISTMHDPLYKQRKDITREVVIAAFSEQSNPDFALDIVKAILQMGHGTGFKDLLHEPEIVNSPNFLCFCLVFIRANIFLRMPNLKQDVADLIEDPKRKEIFLNLDQKEYVDKLIHHNF